jgi:hypothetical protein
VWPLPASVGWPVRPAVAPPLGHVPHAGCAAAVAALPATLSVPSAAGSGRTPGQRPGLQAVAAGCVGAVSEGVLVLLVFTEEVASCTDRSCLLCRRGCWRRRFRPRAFAAEREMREGEWQVEVEWGH